MKKLIITLSILLFLANCSNKEATNKETEAFPLEEYTIEQLQNAYQSKKVVDKRSCPVIH